MELICPKCQNNDKYTLTEYNDALNPIFKCKCKKCGYDKNIEEFALSESSEVKK